MSKQLQPYETRRNVLYKVLRTSLSISDGALVTAEESLLHCGAVPMDGRSGRKASTKHVDVGLVSASGRPWLRLRICHAYGPMGWAPVVLRVHAVSNPSVMLHGCP